MGGITGLRENQSNSSRTHRCDKHCYCISGRDETSVTQGKQVSILCLLPSRNMVHVHKTKTFQYQPQTSWMNSLCAIKLACSSCPSQSCRDPKMCTGRTTLQTCDGLDILTDRSLLIKISRATYVQIKPLCHHPHCWSAVHAKGA